MITDTENKTIDSIMSAIANGKGKALNQQGKILQKNIQASHIVKKIKSNEKIAISLRSNKKSIAIIKDYAKKQGIPYQSFINAYIDEIAEQIAVAN